MLATCMEKKREIIIYIFEMDSNKDALLDNYMEEKNVIPFYSKFLLSSSKSCFLNMAHIVTL